MFLVHSLSYSLVRLYRKNIDYYCFQFQDLARTAYPFFEKYGEVESTRRGIFNGVGYVLVQFKEARVAADLVKKRRIEIDGCKFEIKVFNTHDSYVDSDLCADHFTSGQTTDAGDNETSPLLQPPERVSSQNILNALDNDCLCLIFERIEHLADFHSISNVCNRFKEIAKTIFSLKIRRRKVDFCHFFFGNTILLSDVEMFLRNFGSSIISLELSEFYFEEIPNRSNVILKMINDYCTNLHRFTVGISGVENLTLIEIQPLLSRLKYLNVNQSTLSDDQIAHLVSACPEIEMLEYGDTPRRKREEIVRISLPEITFRKLIEFKIHVGCTNLKEFLACNPQLEKVHGVESSSVCNFALQNMSKLKELTLTNDYDLITDGDRINPNHFNHLRVNMMYTILDGNMDDIYLIKSISELTLYLYTRWDEDHLIRLFQNLKNLKKIWILQGWFATHLITNAIIKNMLQCANNLSELQILGPIDCLLQDFDEIDYDDILKIVKSRNSHMKLKIRLCSQTQYFDCIKDFKEKLIILNRCPEWLTVERSYITFDA